MKALFTEIRGAVAVTIIFAIVCCGLYPLVVFGIAQVAFANKANGSLLVDKTGIVVGSRLLGQGFTGEKYFHTRPSSAGNGYDAANSSGSNLGPTSQKLSDSIKDRIDGYRKENGLGGTDSVPADAVTGSGSGLDPHITLRNAELQVRRVALARGMNENTVKRLMQDNIDGRDLGMLGEEGVNVLALNLALDSLPGKSNHGE